MTREPVLAGIDVGTTNTKLGLYRPDGTRLAFQTSPTPGDADALVTTVLDGLASQVERVGRPPEAIGVTGMAESGAAVTDLTLAGRTGGMDIRAGRYHPDLLAAAGVGVAQLPRIVEPCRAAGRADAAPARRAGLWPGTPVSSPTISGSRREHSGPTGPPLRRVRDGRIGPAGKPAHHVC